MHARERALAVILDAHRRAASAEVAAPSPFHGWPGLVWVEQHVRHATGTPIPELLALARRGRAGRQRPVPLPLELHATFLYGVRGRRWAERALDGRSTDDLGPPEVALGFDTFANDGPVYFAWLVRRTDEDRTWSALLAHERTRFERCRRQRGRAVPLGLAHGAAGLLLRRLLHADDGDPSLRADLHWLAQQRVDDGSVARWPVRRGEAVPRSWVADSLCNGSLGHALLFLEAFACFRDEHYLAIARRALAATAHETRLGLGFCCGHAGRAAVVSRFLRLGLHPGSAEAKGCLERLWARIPSEAASAALRPVSGLASCLPALHAESADAAVLDFFLPAPTRSR